jgi:hypothetical protein
MRCSNCSPFYQPCYSNWIAFASGKRGLSFSTTITQHAATVQLVIDRGKDDMQQVQEFIDSMKQLVKSAIEATRDALADEAVKSADKAA